jgi:hypothetical protein
VGLQKHPFAFILDCLSSPGGLQLDMQGASAITQAEPLFSKVSCGQIWLQNTSLSLFFLWLEKLSCLETRRHSEQLHDMSILFCFLMDAISLSAAC